MTTEQPADQTPDASAAMRAEFAEQIKNVTSQVNGLAGKIDTGLNAIRRDYAQEAQQRKNEAAMAGIPEDMREFIGPLVSKIGALEAQLGNGGAPAPADSGVTQGQDSDLDTLLNGWGLTHNSPGLDWAAYHRGDTQTFLQSTKQAVIQSAQPGGDAPPPPPAASVTTPPPVGGAPAGPPQSNSAMDIMDKWNAGQISRRDYYSQMENADYSGIE